MKNKKTNPIFVKIMTRKINKETIRGLEVFFIQKKQEIQHQEIIKIIEEKEKKILIAVKKLAKINAQIIFDKNTEKETDYKRRLERAEIEKFLSKEFSVIENTIRLIEKENTLEECRGEMKAKLDYIIRKAGIKFELQEFVNKGD